jgi:hypothetical protein
VCPSVRPSNILLARRLSNVWLDGRAEGRCVLSLTHKHKWGGEFSLIHTHTLKSGVSSHSLTHWNREVSSHTHTHTEIGRWVLTHTHTLKWGGEFSLTHALKLGGDFSLTHSNEKVSSQSLTHPRSFTCVNGFTYSFPYKNLVSHPMLYLWCHESKSKNVKILYLLHIFHVWKFSCLLNFSLSSSKLTYPLTWMKFSTSTSLPKGFINIKTFSPWSH